MLRSGIEACHNSANSGFANRKLGHRLMQNTLKRMRLWSALLALAFATMALAKQAVAQDDQDDPPTRVARLGYMEGSVSFQPAGEDEWVGAVDNRPLTTGDKLWVDNNSRAELQLGTAVIRIGANTGISFLNLDDHTIQIQLRSGQIDLHVRRLDGDDDIEVDTPNLAFTALRAGRYRFIIREDGNWTTVGVRAGGDGEATGSGQSYEIQSDEVGNFDGTNNSLSADVEPIPPPDDFDAWVDARDHRWDSSRSAQYLSHDVVGFDDLDDNGDWRDDGSYGHVWYPHVEVGWAPYHTGHWAWIDPWGYTWVDDSPWGYAPFHYGRWVSVGGRWGWIAGPPAERPVYAPALVVFVGGGGGLGGNIAWFPLGPREVFVPSYPVSRTYMTQINVSSTTVNTTTVTNVYNTTIVNKTTTITNVTYANRTVPGAVTAVPQNTFASAQPVAKAAVQVTPQQIASASVSARVAVAPTKAAVLGAKASTAGHVTAPPAAVANRQVVAKKTPPPPPVPFAKKQQAMAAHPGQPLAKKEMATLRPAAAARPAVKVAPPGKPATPTGHPVNAARPGQPAAQPANRPGNQPAPKPAPAAPAQPNRPAAAQPNKAPEPSRPAAEKPAPAKAPETTRPEANRPPTEKPAPAPAPKPEANRPAQPAAHPPAAEPKAEPNRAPADKPVQPAAHPPAAAKPAPPATKPATPPKKPETPEEKKKREQEEKRPQGA